MNRDDFQLITDVRVADAQLLLHGRRFDGAYYLLGYAVECALKSCIAKQIRQYEFPDEKFANESFVHDLAKLLNLSGVKQHTKRSRGEIPRSKEIGPWSKSGRRSAGTSIRSLSRPCSTSSMP